MRTPITIETVETRPYRCYDGCFALSILRLWDFLVGPTSTAAQDEGNLVCMLLAQHYYSMWYVHIWLNDLKTPLVHKARKYWPGQEGEFPWNFPCERWSKAFKGVSEAQGVSRRWKAHGFINDLAEEACWRERNQAFMWSVPWIRSGFSPPMIHFSPRLQTTQRALKKVVFVFSFEGNREPLCWGEI